MKEKGRRFPQIGEAVARSLLCALLLGVLLSFVLLSLMKDGLDLCCFL